MQASTGARRFVAPLLSDASVRRGRGEEQLFAGHIFDSSAHAFMRAVAGGAFRHY